MLNEAKRPTFVFYSNPHIASCRKVAFWWISPSLSNLAFVLKCKKLSSKLGQVYSWVRKIGCFYIALCWIGCMENPLGEGTLSHVTACTDIYWPTPNNSGTRVILPALKDKCNKSYDFKIYPYCYHICGNRYSLKGLFTNCFLFFKSHILDSNGVGIADFGRRGL